MCFPGLAREGGTGLAGRRRLASAMNHRKWRIDDLLLGFLP